MDHALIPPDRQAYGERAKQTDRELKTERKDEEIHRRTDTDRQTESLRAVADSGKWIMP